MEASSIKPSWACTSHMANAERYQTIKPPRGSARKGYFLTINTLEQLHPPALILIWLLELCIPLGNHRFRHGSSERSLETQSTWADLNRSHASMLTNQRVQMRPMHRAGFIHLLHFDSCTMWLTWEELRGLMKITCWALFLIQDLVCFISECSLCHGCSDSSLQTRICLPGDLFSTCIP